MTIKKQAFYIFICLFSLTNAYGQNYKSLCKKSLIENIKGKEHNYSNDSSSVSIKYLGSVRTIKNKLYKIISIKSIWGVNKHTSGYIWIYNAKDQYIGRYILGSATDLPINIKNSALVFSNKNKDCKTTVLSKISFAKGIPSHIFIPACAQYGDIYRFTE